jgi:hypothetical protein
LSRKQRENFVSCQHMPPTAPQPAVYGEPSWRRTPRS